MDVLQRFLFDGMPVRGACVVLRDVWQDVLKRQAQRPGTPAWADAHRALAGEMAAAGVLLHSSITFDGALVLQIQSEGPVQLAVAEVQPDAGLRVTLRGRAPAEAAGDANFAALVGGGAGGRCVMTLKPGQTQPGQQPYQGIVALTDAQGQPWASLAQALTHHMQASEQIDTVLVLAADAQRAAGLLVQRMPVQGAANLEGMDTTAAAQADDDWARLALLARSLRPQELLTLDVSTVLHRLYHAEPLRLLPRAVQPHFACTCSRSRVARMIVGLGQAEAVATLHAHGDIEVSCDFCGHVERFDAAAVMGLFAAPDQTTAH